MKQYIITISDAEYLELTAEHYRLKPVERMTDEQILAAVAGNVSLIDDARAIENHHFGSEE